MKTFRFFILILVAMSTQVVFGQPQGNERQLTLDPASFKADVGAVSGTSMISRFLKNWPRDRNDDNDAALLKIEVKGMSVTDANHLTFTAKGGTAEVIRADYEGLISSNQIYVFLAVTDAEFTLTAHHPKYGTSNSYQINTILKPKGVYSMSVVNKVTQNISITTQPAGVEVVFDGENKGKSPCTLNDIVMGKHSMRIVQNGSVKVDEIVDVSENNFSFTYDLRQKGTLVTICSPGNCKTFVVMDGREIEFQRSIILPYGSYIVKAVSNESALNTDEKFVTINNVQQTIELYPKRQREILFQTHYGGYETASTLYVDNMSKAYNNSNNDPKSQYLVKLPYGNHKVMASCGGSVKKLSFNVNETSPSGYILKIKKNKTAHFYWENGYETRDFGFCAKWVAKSWKTSGEGESFNMRLWDCEKDKMLHGVSTGLYYNPSFAWGGGLYTGIFYEYYFCNNKEWDSDYYKFQEHDMNIPIHLMFRLPFSDVFSLAIHGGVGFDFGIYASVSGDSDREAVTEYYGENWNLMNYSDGYDYKDEEIINPGRFNMAIEGGVILNINKVSFVFDMSKGITNHKSFSNFGNYTTKQNKMSAGIVLAF